jgi:hypothetical protein
MRPLDPACWIEPDAHLPRDLAEKDDLFGSVPDRVFRSVDGSEVAQAETLHRLMAYLPRQFPETHRPVRDGLHIIPTGTTVRPASSEPPLRTAARLVQEDLCILQREDDGWHLTAAALCFPSSWSLAEKIGRPMAAIHDGVPDFAGQMATRVARIFDHLRPEMPVERFNWSIYGDDRLHHPETHVSPEERFPPGCDLARRAHIRVERQTLTRLPETGAILFTIRIYLDPLAALAEAKDGATLAAAMREQLLAMTPEQIAYKGLGQHRDRLATALEAIAARR